MFGLIIKLAGSALIIVSGVVFSRNLTGRLKADIRLSDGLISGFVSLEEYVCGMLMPVEDALKLAAKDAGEASDFFISASDETGNLRERFTKAFECYDQCYCDAVSGFAGGLSASDERERRTAFSIIHKRLSSLRDDAENEYVRLGRLYGGAGILGGLVVVILLL